MFQFQFADEVKQEVTTQDTRVQIIENTTFLSFSFNLKPLDKFMIQHRKKSHRMTKGASEWSNYHLTSGSKLQKQT